MLSRAAAKRRPRSIAIPADAVIDWVLCFSIFFSLHMSGLGATGPVVFLTLGFAIALRRPRRALTSLMSQSLLFALPIFAFLSIIWSDYPIASLRAAAELIPTVMIGVWIGSCFRPKIVISALVSALTLVVIACFIDGNSNESSNLLDNSSGLTGLFESKNQLAECAVIQLLAAVALTLDGAQPFLFRILGIAAAIIASVALFAAQSAGSLIFGIAGVAALVASSLASQWDRSLRLVAVAVALLAGILLILGMTLFFDDIGFILEAFGKDSTFTGRTYLWQHASSYISERPLLGVGYKAFWQLENSRAQELWDFFGVPPGSGFHFHNLYFNTAVELGIIGLALLIMSLVWMSLCLISSLVWDPKTSSNLATGLFVYTLGLSSVEVEWPSPFNISAVMFCLTYCYLKPVWKSHALR